MVFRSFAGWSENSCPFVVFPLRIPDPCSLAGRASAVCCRSSALWLKSFPFIRVLFVKFVSPSSDSVKSASEFSQLCFRFPTFRFPLSPFSFFLFPRPDLTCAPCPRLADSHLDSENQVRPKVRGMARHNFRHPPVQFAMVFFPKHPTTHEMFQHSITVAFFQQVKRQAHVRAKTVHLG